MKARLNGFSAKDGMQDERSIDHPSHKAQWFEIARAIGRQIARDERDGCSGQHIGG